MSADVKNLRPGDLVEITIRRGVVAAVGVGANGGAEEVSVSHGKGQVLVPVGDPSIVIERLAPADWPPRAGDLWRDCDGALWFAILHHATYAHHGTSSLQLHRSVDRANDSARTPDQLLQHSGPVELLHREPEHVDAGGDE